MDSSQIQTPVDKVSLEFVDKSTQIVNLVAAHLEQGCSHCFELIKNGIGNQPIPDAEATNPGPTGYDYKE
jgi:hypothetical protein